MRIAVLCCLLFLLSAPAGRPQKPHEFQAMFAIYYYADDVAAYDCDCDQIMIVSGPQGAVCSVDGAKHLTFAPGVTAEQCAAAIAVSIVQSSQQQQKYWAEERDVQRKREKSLLDSWAHLGDVFEQHLKDDAQWLDQLTPKVLYFDGPPKVQYVTSH